MTSPAQPELSTSEVVAALKATRLFSVLEPPELLALSPLFVPVRLEPGDVVCSQGQVDRCLWVVVDGAVGLSAEGGTEAPAAYRAFGDTLGLCGVFLGEARGSTAVVVQPAVLLRAERLPFLAALARHRDLYDRLVLDESIRSRLTPGELPKAAGGEYRVGLYRRHWVVLARRLVLPAAMLVGLLLAAAVVSGLTALGPGSSPALALLLVAVALGVPGALAVWVFYDYYHDVLIVTNRRIVHIERTPFVDAARTEALLTRVQDVTSVVPGPTARAVGYGTVIVQTASTRGAIAFDRVPRPDAVRDTIVRQLDQSKEEVRRERDDWLRDKVLRAIGGHEAVPPPAEPQEAPRPGASEPVAFHRLVLGSLGSMAGHFWPQMRSQEGDVITWRKHWVVLLRAALLPCAVLGCLALVGVVLWRLGRPSALLPLGGGTLLALGWLVWRFENWRNDLYQVTGDHVIDIERLPMGLFEERRQASLAQIQDVRYRVPNPLANLLDYGDVIIQTAAEEGGFVFRRVYRPAGVQAEIFRRIERFHERQRRAEEERRADEMAAWLRAYHDVTGRPPADGADGVPAP